MKRRAFLQGAAAGAAISTLDWLSWFESFGVPGTHKELGLASAAAQAAQDPHFLIVWFQEGGWDGYSMFNPLDTRNDAILSIPAGTLNPTPSWSAQYYRPKNYGSGGAAQLPAPTRRGNITAGYLADDGAELFGDLAVLSSHTGNVSHSPGRWEYHYGRYGAEYQHGLPVQPRGPDERSLMQAFCEQYGASALMPNIAWHRWLSDGELALASFPEGTGFYEKLGPAHAHTLYGKTPGDLRSRLKRLGAVTTGVRGARIRQFVDDLHRNFVADRHSETVKAFDAAVKIHQRQVSGGVGFDPESLFAPALLEEFGVAQGDLLPVSMGQANSPARSKESPATNVQAAMTYDLLTRGVSVGFWLENRVIREFDNHRSRTSARSHGGQTDQRQMMAANLWTPLKTLVRKLKAQQLGATGKSYWDFTNIVLASEMGRTIQADVASILGGTSSDAQKYTDIMEQDVSQHWKTHSVAFLGGNVRGDRQWGKVGSNGEPIPLLPDGTLDPAYDPMTGARVGTKSPFSFVPHPGHIYSTALHLCGLSAPELRLQGKGRNPHPPLQFIKK